MWKFFGGDDSLPATADEGRDDLSPASDVATHPDGRRRTIHFAAPDDLEDVATRYSPRPSVHAGKSALRPSLVSPSLRRQSSIGAPTAGISSWDGNFERPPAAWIESLPSGRLTDAEVLASRPLSARSAAKDRKPSQQPGQLSERNLRKMDSDLSMGPALSVGPATRMKSNRRKSRKPKEPTPKTCSQWCKSCRRNFRRQMRMHCNINALARHWTMFLEPWVTQQVIASFAAFELLVSGLMVALFYLNPLVSSADMFGWPPLWFVFLSSTRVICALTGIHAACKRNVTTSSMYAVFLIGAIMTTFRVGLTLFTVECTCGMPLNQRTQCKILWSFYLGDHHNMDSDLVDVAELLEERGRYSNAEDRMPEVPGLGQLTDRLQLSPSVDEGASLEQLQVLNFSNHHYFDVGANGIRFTAGQAPRCYTFDGIDSTDNWDIHETCDTWDALMTVKNNGARPTPSCTWDTRVGSGLVDWTPHPLNHVLRLISAMLARCALDEFCGLVEARLSNRSSDFLVCSYFWPIVPEVDCRDPFLMCERVCIDDADEIPFACDDEDDEFNQPSVADTMSLWYEKNLGKATQSMLANQRVAEESVDLCRLVTYGLLSLMGVLNSLSFIMIVVLRKFLGLRCGDHVVLEKQFTVEFSDSDDSVEFESQYSLSTARTRSTIALSRSNTDKVSELGVASVAPSYWRHDEAPVGTSNFNPWASAIGSERDRGAAVPLSPRTHGDESRRTSMQSGVDESGHTSAEGGAGGDPAKPAEANKEWYRGLW